MASKNPQKVNLRQVAQLAGCSVSTAWKVIHQHPECGRFKSDTVQRILRVAEQLNYTEPKIKRRLNQPFSIGFCSLNQSHSNSKRHVFNLLLEGILAGLSEISANLIMNSNSDFEKSLQLLEDNQLDGLIVLEPDPAALRRMSESAVHEKILAINPFASSPIKLSQINMDPLIGIECIIDYLISLGRDSIAYIDQQGEPIDHVYAQRKSAFEIVAAKHNFKNCWIVDCGKTQFNIHRSGYCDFWDGFYAVEWLLKNHLTFDTVIAYSDLTAVGAVERLNQSRILVPDSVSIIGMDDNPISEFSKPPLTTLAYPLFEIGRQAVELIHQQIQTHPAAFTARNIIIYPELKLRSSVVSATA